MGNVDDVTMKQAIIVDVMKPVPSLSAAYSMVHPDVRVRKWRRM